MDELQQLLNALGASSFAEALTIINRFNAFVTDARVATATEDLAGAGRAIQANASGLRQIEALTGKKGDEAVAAVTAWKDSAASAAVAQAAVAELLSEDELKALGEEPSIGQLVNAVQAKRKKAEDEDAKGKLDAAVADGRLRPANRQRLEKLYANFGMAALDDAIEALHPDGNAPTGTEGPRPPVAGNSTALTPEDIEVGTQLGLSKEQILANKQRANQSTEARAS